MRRRNCFSVPRRIKPGARPPGWAHSPGDVRRADLVLPALLALQEFHQPIRVIRKHAIHFHLPEKHLQHFLQR